MPVDFPIGTKVISLGRVADPVVPLALLTRRGYLPFDFLVDTGADCSMMPAAIAETELGIDLGRCSQEIFFGIEGAGVRVYRGWIALKIGPYPFRVRCVFSPREHTPLILGRMDLFRHFS
ncbi:MAG: retroviral-like aspartic protease family protein, partial [Candidatus Omnitrophica bacterium]|nr:retroviral-like aspartic protease family protein [Candidatus Omnitrophota bacterium]